MRYEPLLRPTEEEPRRLPPEPQAPVPADRLLALQRTAGNAAVARLLAPSRPTLARTGHRPKKDQQIRIGKDIWTVDESREGNATVKVSRPKVGGKGNAKEFRTIAWETDEFTIVRPNSDVDYDMREALENADNPIFDRAKAKALELLKDYVISAGDLKRQQQERLKQVTVASFQRTRVGEWRHDWVEGDASNPNRDWVFTLDADKPEADSDQEPHVGWTAEAPKSYKKLSPVVTKRSGHIWVKEVAEFRT